MTTPYNYPYNEAAAYHLEKEGTVEVLVLFGSPRKEGNTMELVKIFETTLQSKGHLVKIEYLNDLNIGFCQGCSLCLPDEICTIRDDMDTLRESMLRANLIVFASPVYWYTISAQLKVVIDRSLAFLDSNYNSRLKGKKAVTLMTCGSEDPAVCNPALDSFRMTFNLLGLTYAGHVEALGCTEKGVVREEYKDEARRLALSLA